MLVVKVRPSLVVTYDSTVVDQVLMSLASFPPAAV